MKACLRRRFKKTHLHKRRTALERKLLHADNERRGEVFFIKSASIFQPKLPQVLYTFVLFTNNTRKHSKWSVRKQTQLSQCVANSPHSYPQANNILKLSFDKCSWLSKRYVPSMFFTSNLPPTPNFIQFSDVPHPPSVFRAHFPWDQ